jgi:Fe-S-cluster containining protein
MAQLADLTEYLALRDRVDAFADGVQQRRAADMQCRRGCAGCCHAELAVCAVEAAAIRAQVGALDEPARAALRARAAVDTAEPRCVMLGADDACAIYAARPLVCRSQGLPLRYPAELIPEQSVRARAGAGAVTWCPLNFTAAKERPPAAADVLDAERVDQTLALINRRYADRTGADPLARVPLRTLAR